MTPRASGTIAPPPAPAARAQADREITLPSGKRATIAGRPLKGRDVIQAERYRGDGDTAVGLALMAAVVTLDGRPCVYEDMLDLDLVDIGAISEALRADSRFPQAALGGAPGSPPASPPSLSSGSGSTS